MPTALITGGHAGLGLKAAEAIAAAGWDLILAGRDPARVGAAAAGLGAQVLPLDLTSLASVRAAAAQVGAIDALLCNAGVRVEGPPRTTVDGFEETFQVNHLAHFLLVELLRDRLAAGGRVVITASGTHDPATMDGRLVGRALAPDARLLAHATASPGVRYASSKLCNVMHAYALHRRGVGAIAYDPGLIPETGLARDFPAFARAIYTSAPLRVVMKAMGVTMGSLAFSGASLGALTTDAGFRSGTYLQSDGGVLREARSSAASYDEAAGERLWADSAALVGL